MLHSAAVTAGFRQTAPPLAARTRAEAASPAAPILLSPPHLTGQELPQLQAMFEAGWLAPAGPFPRAFEDAIAAAIGLPHVLATASGTAALHLGYRLLGVAPGDEVWTTTLTFAATIAPAVELGATPRFFDVDPATGLLDLDLLRDELAAAARRGRLPRVVVPVDLYGSPVDIAALREICDPWGVPILSDSAEALGSRIDGRHAGFGAKLIALSFNGNKIVTAGGGGALAGEDARLIEQARRLANHAREDAAHYEHAQTGYAYGLSSALAAIGLAQIATLAARVAARRAVFARYRAALADLPGLSFLAEPRGAIANRWLTVIRLCPRAGAPGRELLRRRLAAAGIETRPVFKPLHLQPAFRHAPQAGGAQAAMLFEEGLCLPSGSALTREEQARVIEAIRAAFARG
ncbi:MAG: DegT/DnrJ/EryC1/StrS family aminotransferase [Rhodovarius sp.]|nr:DegT/DnrJ/EryC1/StrS family aminotransferase [Rhodovarius sp.]MCX7933428.1 DegT/DnrJ/EryC1/StrS family aminotransferase [Rhodovarius sp.]MDW8315682.1 DegT/DnrJ/EryC1/StrS family aminotransferase [Rhodovarius sp.]